MTDDANDQGQDVFDDQADSGSSAVDEASITTPEDTGVELEESGDESQTGDDEAVPPADNQDDPETVVDAKGQKMIPEHRFKAALKKVTDELEEKTNRLKEYETPKIEVPDPETDPEAYNLHIRMEASAAAWREAKPDYQEVINHYATMAEENDLLNQAVAKDPFPARLAYNIAKRDLEIKEALNLKNSDEYKEFQEWKKTKDVVLPKVEEQSSLNNVINRGLKAVPNLNRMTNASPNRNVRKVSNGDNDDDLFAGAL